MNKKKLLDEIYSNCEDIDGQLLIQYEEVERLIKEA